MQIENVETELMQTLITINIYCCKNLYNNLVKSFTGDTDETNVLRRGIFKIYCI